MRRAIARCDKAGQACQHDIFRLQIRIALGMPDAGGKQEQEDTQELPPGDFLGKCQTQHEKQGEPAEHRIDADAYQIPDQMPFAWRAARCPQEQQHDEIAD